MTESEVLGASQQRLVQWADFLGLRPSGKRGTYWIRKSARHPITKRDFTLKESMRTTDLRTAIVRAQPVVQRFLAGIQTTLAPMVSTNPGKDGQKLGEVFDKYEAWEHGKERTRHRNVASLTQIVKDMNPTADVRALSIDVIDSKLARQWLEEQKRAAALQFLPKQKEEFERRKRSRNQILANAQSVFSRRAVQYLQDSGLRIPDTARAFATELGLDARPAPPPQVFSPKEIEAIHAGLPKLKEQEPATYAAIMLMLHAGLRNCEILEARWGWIGTVDGRTFIDLSTNGTFEPKGRDGWVEIDPNLPKLIRSSETAPKASAFIVEGLSEHDRWQTCYRRINAYIATCGVERINGKLAYRARGHAITQIYLAHGAGAAKEFARHSTQRTTDRYYMGAKMPYTPLQVAG
jgi:ribosomal protein S7